MKNNIIKIKSFDFALKIVKLYRDLIGIKEFVLSKQLLRSGTSIGAMVREAEQAESRADFIHKLSIALKEANESEYWIELLFKSNYLNEMEYTNIVADLKEILKLLTSIIKTSKQKK
jgi:four helix bundle protein